MKKNKYLGYIFLFLFASCKNAEYKIIENAVYLNSAAVSTQKSETITINNGADIQLLVRIAKPNNEDVEVGLAIDNSTIEPYNKANNAEYLQVPNFTLPADAKVTIPAGEVSATYKIHIDDFPISLGSRYAIGVALTNVLKGAVTISQSQSKFIYLLSKPLLQNVPEFTPTLGQLNAAPSTPWGIKVNQWSLECWAKMSAYRRNNQAIFNSGSSEHEIYIRFGDANSPYNYLQIKTLGGQVQTKSDLVANTWYHWAFVYDGTTLSIYRNGELDTRFNPPAPAGGNVRFDYLSMVSSGSYFIDRVQLAQARLWNTAITQSQIKNNMYFDVNPKNTSLIAYWPMSEAINNSFSDITGNGHTATATVNNLISSWIPNVNFRN